MSGPVHVCLMMVNRWAYVYVRGLKQNKEVDFDFEDAHDLDMTKSRPRHAAHSLQG